MTVKAWGGGGGTVGDEGVGDGRGGGWEGARRWGHTMEHASLDRYVVLSDAKTDANNQQGVRSGECNHVSGLVAIQRGAEGRRVTHLSVTMLCSASHSSSRAPPEPTAAMTVATDMHLLMFQVSGMLELCTCNMIWFQLRFRMLYS